MGRVYSGNIWDTPDDPKRVGDEDYQPSYSIHERDPDADYDQWVYEEMLREQKDNSRTVRGRRC